MEIYEIIKNALDALDEETLIKAINKWLVASGGDYSKIYKVDDLIQELKVNNFEYAIIDNKSWAFENIQKSERFNFGDAYYCVGYNKLISYLTLTSLKECVIEDTLEWLNPEAVIKETFLKSFIDEEINTNEHQEKFPSLETIQQDLVKYYKIFKKDASILDGVNKVVYEEKAQLIAVLCSTWFKVDIEDIL